MNTILWNKSTGKGIGTVYTIETPTIYDVIRILGGRIIMNQTDPEYNEEVGNVILSRRYKFSDLFLIYRYSNRTGGM